jgi:metal-dependent amidase/aminoacylase/carboxypeptidase family protein
LLHESSDADWSGTLMLIVEPTEERLMGVKMMMHDKLWKRFGLPDYALAFHVDPDGVAGKNNIIDGPPSPLFKIEPKPSVIKGTEAIIYALLELMPKQ